MKKLMNIVGYLSLLIVFGSFGYISLSNKTYEIPLKLKSDNSVLVNFPSLCDSYPVKEKKEIDLINLKSTYLGFKEALAFKESGCNYFITNKYGYMGKYQFGASTLELMGVYDTAHFLNDPKLQEQIFELNVSRNKWILQDHIDEYIGRRMKGLQVTESGMIAAAHLAGAGNVKKFLRSNGRKDFKDGNGTSVSYYMKKFAGYDISEILAIHSPKI